MQFEEKELTRKKVYDFPSFSINESEVIMPDGSHRIRNWLQHNGSSAILALDDEAKRKSFMMASSLRTATW